MWLKWIDVGPSVLLFLLAVLALVYLFASDLFRRRKPTRQVKVALTGPTYARVFFAHSVGLDHAGRAFLLLGTSDNAADVYLVELQAGETVSWFTHDAEILGLTVGTVETLEVA